MRPARNRKVGNMALDWIDICNAAIALVGGAPITSLNEPSKEAQRCSTFLPQVRTSVLSKHAWNCATSWHVPAMVGEAGKDGKPAWPYRYAFAVPKDFLRIVRIETGLPTGSAATCSAGAEPYRMALYNEQQVLICNLSSPTVVYIADPSNPHTLDPELREVLIFSLAARLALPLSEDARRAQLFMDKAREALQEAMLVDARSGHEVVPRDDTWLREQAGISREDWIGLYGGAR